MRVALRVDDEVGLKERLSSSLALMNGLLPAGVQAAFQGELVEKLHSDALLSAQSVEPAQAFPFHMQRRPLAYAAACLGWLWFWFSCLTRWTAYWQNDRQWRAKLPGRQIRLRN